MVASDSFAEFLREQLAPLGRVTMRRMFGKTGVFCNGLMFGMVTNDTLYFRVDDHNRAVFKEPNPPRPSTTRSRAAPSTSPFGTCRSGCSTNPKSLSPGRGRRWRRRAGSRRSGTGRAGENRSRDPHNCEPEPHHDRHPSGGFHPSDFILWRMTQRARGRRPVLPSISIPSLVASAQRQPSPRRWCRIPFVWSVTGELQLPRHSGALDQPPCAQGATAKVRRMTAQ